MRIAAGEFKAKCLKLMDEVCRTGEEIVITKRGRAVARLVSVKPAKRRSRLLGCMAGTVKVTGDIIGPTGEQWDADQ
jgi:prevent-host-death family protein